MKKSLLVLITLLAGGAAYADTQIDVCTPDVNPWGHPSACTCSEGGEYNPQAGLCVPAAFESPCDKTLKLAARKALAKKLEAKLSKVSVAFYEPGPWTEAVADNTGWSEVTVQHGEGVQVTYRVSGQQIGNSDRCKVTGIKLVSTD